MNDCPNCLLRSACRLFIGLLALIGALCVGFPAWIYCAGNCGV
jgi:hypothetical protein